MLLNSGGCTAGRTRRIACALRNTSSEMISGAASPAANTKTPSAAFASDEGEITDAENPRQFKSKTLAWPFPGVAIATHAADAIFLQQTAVLGDNRFRTVSTA
jgi:hypothetical protein